MPADPRTLRFPPSDQLAAFFRMDPDDPVPVPQLAQLLDAPADQVRDILRRDGIELRSDALAWGEAAAYLLDAWPRAQLLDALGPDLAERVPAAFHPTPVRWRIPAFIVRALEHQAAQLQANDPRLHPTPSAAARFTSPSVEDYIADLLFNEIEPATVDALADDPGFLQAYGYPMGE